MENSWSLDPLLWIVIGLISVAAVVTGVGLIAKAFSFQNQYSVSLLICFLCTVLLTVAGLLVPLLILSGQPYDQHNLLIDILMIGITMLVLIAIGSFIVDHLAERPNVLMISAAACFAIALVPWTYQLFRNPLNDHFRIMLTQPDLDVPRSLDDFSDRYAPATEASAASVDENSQPVSESVNPEEEDVLPMLGPRSTNEPDWLYGDQ